MLVGSSRIRLKLADGDIVRVMLDTAIAVDGVLEQRGTIRWRIRALAETASPAARSPR
jgi:hypothetical protein